MHRSILKATQDNFPSHRFAGLEPLYSKRYFATAGLPELACEGHEADRPIFNKFYSNMGDCLQIAMLLPGDCEAVCDVLDDEADRAREAGEEFMAPRAREIIRDKMASGKLIVYGVIVNGDGLGAIAAMESIDDEKGMGRGEAFYGLNGKCGVDEQVWFKMATTHPDMRETGIIRHLFVPRLIGTMAVFPERTCMVMKSNNPAVMDFYENKADWHAVNSDKKTLAHLENPEHRTLKTFATNVDESTLWIKNNNPDMMIEDHVEQHRAAYKKVYGVH